MSYPQTEKEWNDLTRILPGYDPWENADGYHFDYKEAEDRMFFFENGCTFVEGKMAGQPLDLQPWLQSFLCNLFAWKKRDGFRRYRECMMYVPRGNSKTTTAAAMVLSVMAMDGEAAAQCCSAAATRDQARLCFKVVSQMIRNSTFLSSKFEVLQRSITTSSAEYKAVASDAGALHGGSLQLIINDELHAHKNEEVTEALMTSTLKRQQPIIAHLTTADYDRPSVCNQKYDYACKVRDGLILDPAFLPAIYEASEEDDWEDEATWEKANPNWPVMDHEYFTRECKRAISDPAYRNTFKRLHLNLKTSSNVSAFDMVHWDDCDERNPVDSVKSKPCYASLDVSSKSDLTALIIEVPHYKGDSDEISIESVDIFSWFWVPQEAVSRRSREKSLFATYSGWAERSELFIQPGQRIDQDDIREFINGLRDEGWNIQSIAYDPWNAESIRQGLESDGFEMIEFTQTIKNFSEPFKDLVSLVSEHKVRHGMQPVLRWNASNCVSHADTNGNIRPDKKNSIDKIDGIVSLIMAHATAMQERIDDEGGLVLL